MTGDRVPDSPMTDPDNLLNLAEQTHRNIERLAALHDADDRLVDDVSPREELAPGEAMVHTEMCDERRATLLLLQNAKNIRRILSATGVDRAESDSDEGVQNTLATHLRKQ